VVITEGAYLHCFDSANIEDAEPIVSVCLRRAEVETPSPTIIPQNGHLPQPPAQLQSTFLSPPLQNTFEVVSPHAYRFTTAARLTFLGQSAREVEEWVTAIITKATEPENGPSVVEEVRQDGMEDFVLLVNKPATLSTASAPVRTDLRRNMMGEFGDDMHDFELDEFGIAPVTQPKKKPNTSRSPEKSKSTTTHSPARSSSSSAPPAAARVLIHQDTMETGGSSDGLSTDYAFIDVS